MCMLYGSGMLSIQKYLGDGKRWRQSKHKRNAFHYKVFAHTHTDTQSDTQRTNEREKNDNNRNENVYAKMMIITAIYTHRRVWSHWLTFRQNLYICAASKYTYRQLESKRKREREEVEYAPIFLKYLKKGNICLRHMQSRTEQSRNIEILIFSLLNWCVCACGRSGVCVWFSCTSSEWL